MHRTNAHATARRARIHPLGVLLIAMLVLFAAGCGLALGTGPHKTELFRKLTVDGDFHPGGTVTLHLQYEQPYDVDVRAHCSLLRVNPGWTPTPKPQGPTPTATPVVVPRVHPTPSNTIYEILADTIPANPNGGQAGEVTPVPGVIERDVTIPNEAGRYAIRCWTPLDVNNQIITNFTIRPREQP